MFSKKTTMTTLMDQMLGTISSSLGVSVDVMLDLEKMDESVEKILEVDFCSDNVTVDDTFFSFSNEDLERMERRARNKSEGMDVLDLGCGFMEVKVPTKALSGLTTIENLSPKESGDVLERTFTDVGTAVGNSGEPTDAASIKLGFNKNALFSIPKTLTRMVLTPKVTTLYQISNVTINDIVLDVRTGYDFSKAARTFFDYVVREASAALLEIVFNRVKKELIALIELVIIKIIKEKIQLFIGSIAGIYLSKTDSDPSKVLNALAAASDSVDSFSPDTGQLL
jgi:hypothetical protein